MDHIASHFGFSLEVLVEFFSSYWHLLQRLFEAMTTGRPNSLESGFYLLLMLSLPCLVFWCLVKATKNKSLDSFVSPIERVIKFSAQICSLLVLVLMVAMVYEVFARYVFKAPTIWAFEVSYMLMGTIFILSIAYCLQIDQHVRVDFLYAVVGHKNRSVINLIGYLIVLPMLFWITAGMFEYFLAAFEGGETSGESVWNPGIWPFRFVFIMGFVLLLLQVIIEIAKAVRSILQPSARVSEKDE